MEKLILLALVICVSSVYGDGHEGMHMGNEGMGMMGAPEKCCIEEEQFTMKKTIQTGTVGMGFFQKFRGQMVILEDAKLAFDYTNGKVAGFGIQRFLDDKPDFHVHVIADLNEGVTHAISLLEEKCSKLRVEDAPFFPPRCVPEPAFWTGNATFAPRYTTDTWTMFLENDRRAPVAGVYSLTVNHETCVPLSETFAGRSNAWGRNQQIVTSTGFFDYSSGISDEDMEKFFTLPEYCSMEEDERPDGDSDEEDKARKE